VDEGFIGQHSLRALVRQRVATIAVKLKGETARTTLQEVGTRGGSSSIARSPVVVGYTVPRRISLQSGRNPRAIRATQ